MANKLIQYVLTILTAISILFIMFLFYGLYKDFYQPDKPILKIRAVNMYNSFKFKDLSMIYEILSEKFTLIETIGDDYNIIIDGVYGNKKLIDKKYAIKIFMTGEAVPPKLKGYDLSIGFDYIDAPNYIRIPLYYFHFQDFSNNISVQQIDLNINRGECNPNKKYFACFLVSNFGYNNAYEGCVARNKLFHKLSQYKKVHSGGKHLNNINKIIPKTQTAEFFSNCKFVIAYENQKYEGYITEKPIQAYLSGSVPIYRADNSVLKDINQKALIFANNFKSDEELINYIKKVDQDKDLYCKIFKEQIIVNPQNTYEAKKLQLKKKLEHLIKTKLNIKYSQDFDSFLTKKSSKEDNLIIKSLNYLENIRREFLRVY